VITATLHIGTVHDMSEWLLSQIWADYRRYAKVFLVDLMVAISLWALLAAFRWVTHLIPVDETAGRIIGIIHSGGVVCVFGVLAGTLVWDVIRIKRGKAEMR
jgi:hypothetical protein